MSEDRAIPGPHPLTRLERLEATVSHLIATLRNYHHNEFATQGLDDLLALHAAEDAEAAKHEDQPANDQHSDC